MKRNEEIFEIIKRVTRSAQLAMLLEVSAYPKPGNVHRLRDFKETRYAHFLVSSSIAIEYFRKGALKGLGIGLGLLEYEDANIGKLIKDCIEDVMREQHGGNTCLGTVTLLIPLSIASSCTAITKGNMYENLRTNLSSILKATTPSDAVAFYKAIKIANPNIGKSKWLDAYDESSIETILKENITLYQIFNYSSKYDSIAREWVTDFKVTFEIGAPYLHSLLNNGYDINTAIVHTFLKILSEIPDTLIIRKAGRKKAIEVSKMAKEVLEMGGLRTQSGKKLLMNMDLTLREKDNLLNPGTTADLTASSIMLVLLRGFRF